jgi:Trypsin-like peptidase domain
MTFYIKNSTDLNNIRIYSTLYTQITTFTPPYSAVSYLTAGNASGSGVVIAPSFVLTAWHVLKDAAINEQTVERAANGVDPPPDGSRQVSSIDFIRQGSFTTRDLAVAKIDGSFSLPRADIPALMAFADSSQRGNALLQNAYSVGSAGLYDDAGATVEAQQTAYRLNVDATGKYLNASGTWTDPNAIGAAGHSGGPLFVTQTSGTELGRLLSRATSPGRTRPARTARRATRAVSAGCCSGPTKSAPSTTS